MGDRIMSMKLNYKKLLVAHLFVDFLLLAIFLRHDSYHVFLAIVAVMSAYAIVSFAARSKIWMLLMFMLISVVICQVSVTVKKSQLDPEFSLEVQENPTGAIVADVVHGLKRIYGCPSEIKQAFIEAKNDETYSLLEDINYRYLTMLVLMPLMALFLLLKKMPKEVIKEKKGKNP